VYKEYLISTVLYFMPAIIAYAANVIERKIEMNQQSETNWNRNYQSSYGLNLLFWNWNRKRYGEFYNHGSSYNSETEKHSFTYGEVALTILSCMYTMTLMILTSFVLIDFIVST